ncbi:hypothetical protein Y032_0013g2077 [Ancylostoma ceylanicum]|uniref:Uncharacterized protein n=1 Tax=Ancylostoma ceylanicum TaxID=53326 RepID=A0A016VDB5_9BILA|nr:hypothetical protein Y032_0013g2077 [Ancylostoma ceylanicum]
MHCRNESTVDDEPSQEEDVESWTPWSANEKKFNSKMSNSDHRTPSAKKLDSVSPDLFLRTPQLRYTYWQINKILFKYRIRGHAPVAGRCSAAEDRPAESVVGWHVE